MDDIKDVFSSIYQNWGFGGWPHSRSGPGSTLHETEQIRKKIRKLIDAKDIKTVVDIPCGDFHWMKEIVYGFEKYTGGDIVPEVIKDNQKYANQIINFVEFDLTSDEEIPEADLLIVRDVIGHLPREKGKKVIENILKSKCKYLLSTTWYNMNDSTYHEMHENTGVTPGRFYPVCLSAEPFNLPLPEFYIEESPVVDHYDTGTRKGLGFWDLELLRGNKKRITNPNVTIVTGLWNLGRGEGVPDSFKRPYEHYLETFAQLLRTPSNMYIYVAKEDEDFIWQHRSKKNTQVRVVEIEDFKMWFPFYQEVQDIRVKEEWRKQAAWLEESPQANLPFYNPVVMNKFFMLNDASISNPFNTEYFYWIDAGIANTVHPGYFYHDGVFDNLPQYSEAIDKLLFLSYPYDGASEIHGFERPAIARYAGTDYVKYVCRGGFFGGKKSHINAVNGIYYSYLASSLKEGYMGTEESIFAIIAHRYPDLVHRFELSGNGLIWPFFEELKDVDTLVKNTQKKTRLANRAKNIIYILGFNSPKQFESICQSIEKADPMFFKKSKKILINNSTDESLFEEYDQMCKVFDFEEIHRENLGVCGGRQFAAEHFDKTDYDFYMFFEDDMHLNDVETIGHFCRNGFRKYVPNLYDTVIKIMLKENFDFLKFSFSEFYGDNSVQWAWYNVPQKIRSKVWPQYDQLPEHGLDPNAPKAQYDTIHYMNQIPYTKGQIYYSNWPQIVSREGNKKMFLNTTWARPYEQTWMSHIFQMTLDGEVTAGILLASPVTHERFEFYEGNLRKES
jgi:SAM-dependent methyltransferase